MKQKSLEKESLSTILGFAMFDLTLVLEKIDIEKKTHGGMEKKDRQSFPFLWRTPWGGPRPKSSHSEGGESRGPPPPPPGWGCRPQTNGIMAIPAKPPISSWSIILFERHTPPPHLGEGGDAPGSEPVRHFEARKKGETIQLELPKGRGNCLRGGGGREFLIESDLKNVGQGKGEGDSRATLFPLVFGIATPCSVQFNGNS